MKKFTSYGTMTSHMARMIATYVTNVQMTQSVSVDCEIFLRVEKCKHIFS